MNPTAVTRAIALVLILCLTALDAAHHVLAQDAGTAQADCSLCASGTGAGASGDGVQLPVVPLRHVAVAAPAIEVAARTLARRVTIRGPPSGSVA